MTNNNLFYVGKLGKPHSLKGFQYINIDIFFRNHNLNGSNLKVGKDYLIVEDFKNHLKDRNLIKFKNFDTIESIQNLRDSDVSISKDLVNTFINEYNLPWPGFFKGLDITNGGMVLNSVHYLNKMIFCNVEGIKDFLVPYNDNYFKYNNGKLELINDSLTTQPFKD